MSTVATETHRTLDNPLSRYYQEIQQAMTPMGVADHSDPVGFAPGFLFPELDPALKEFFSAAEIGLTQLPDYRGRTLRLLDLMRNPRTRTTKTLASLTIVARAVRYIQQTGERIMIVTPSSANKATALRDAVLRAIETGLVTEHQLQITTVVPAVSAQKLWSSPLATDPALRLRNPMVVHRADRPEAVKQLAGDFVAQNAARFRGEFGVNLWYTLDLNNYMAADMVRAFVERDELPTAGAGRIHAHSVSSAFGLLGHRLGRQVVQQAGGADLPTARYFLVQHLGTPDMVLSLRFGSHDRSNLPRYRFNAADGLYYQEQDRHFPASTFHPQEELDPTFYTSRPATSERMDPLIKEHGGGGIVVSLHECLRRYAEVRQVLAGSGIALPADPRRLREWSLVMALTGVLNAVDRGLLDGEDDILVHGSGSYGQDDFEPLAPEHRCTAADTGELTALAERAARL